MPLPMRDGKHFVLAGRGRVSYSRPVTQGKLYLVTGGAGFIGSNIAEALVKRGGRVRILDNFVSGRRENLDAIARALKNWKAA